MRNNLGFNNVGGIYQEILINIQGYFEEINLFLMINQEKTSITC